MSTVYPVRGIGLFLCISLSGCLLAIDRPDGDGDGDGGSFGGGGGGGNGDGGGSGNPLNADGWVDVAVGSFTTCALRSDGAAACSGFSGWEYLDGTWLAISAHHDSDPCGLRDDGHVLCGLPRPSFELEGDFIAVGGSSRAGCAVRRDNTTRCWPDDIVIEGVSKVSAGSYAACGISAAGQLGCWPINDVLFAEELYDVPSGNFVQVEVAGDIACAIESSGAVRCWGDGDFSSAITGPNTGNVVDVSLLDDLGAVVLGSGAVQLWGDEASDPNNGGTQIPTNSEFNRISVTQFEGCGVTTDSRLECW